MTSGELMELPAPPTHGSVPAVVRMGNPLDLSPVEFRQALGRRSDNRKALIEWIRASLVDGVDYGTVRLRGGGQSKPSLRKPGAEKICGMLGVIPRFPTLRDYERAALDGRPIDQIILRCEIHNVDGVCLAEGAGARVLAQDNGDLNKALKMSEKSAHINATLRLSGLSEIFTQDLEDMPQGVVDDFDRDNERIPHDRPSAPASSAPPVDRPTPSPHHSKVGGDRFATAKQVKLVQIRLDQGGVPEQELLMRYGIPELEQLPFTSVNDALAWITSVSNQ